MEKSYGCCAGDAFPSTDSAAIRHTPPQKLNTSINRQIEQDKNQQETEISLLDVEQIKYSQTRN